MGLHNATGFQKKEPKQIKSESIAHTEVPKYAEPPKQSSDISERCKNMSSDYAETILRRVYDRHYNDRRAARSLYQKYENHELDEILKEMEREMVENDQMDEILE